MGKSAKGIVSKPLDYGGNYGGMLGGAKDLLFGKKDKGTAGGYMALEGSQKKALGQYEKLLDTNTDQLAKTMAVNQEKQIRAGAQDAERRASQLVAQRGLGGSAVGLNAMVNASRGMGDKIGAVRAQLPGMQYDLRNKNLDNATRGIQNILTNRVYQQGTPGGGRSGGLAPILGMGLGAAFGGPAGAQIGGGLGSALTQLG